MKSNHFITLFQILLNVRRKLNKCLDIASNQTHQQETIEKYHNFVLNHGFDGMNLQFDDKNDRYWMFEF